MKRGLSAPSVSDWIFVSGGARNRHNEVLAHHVLAGDHLLDAAPLLVEHHRGELAQRNARLIQRAAVRVHAGQFLDEADVAVVRFQINRGERNLSLFHLNLLAEQGNRLRQFACSEMTKMRMKYDCKTSVVDATTKILQRGNVV